MARTMAEMLISKGRREGEVKGRQEGRQEEAIHARQQTLLTLLRTRFGKLPAKLVKRLEATNSVEQLDAWLVQFANAETLADLRNLTTKTDTHTLQAP